MQAALERQRSHWIVSVEWSGCTLESPERTLDPDTVSTSSVSTLHAHRLDMLPNVRVRHTYRLSTLCLSIVHN